LKNNQDKPEDAAGLRHRAEQRLRRMRPEGVGQRTEVEAVRLIHELEVHQIQLEMQQEELQQTRANMEALLAQYTDLYDFAPTGYLTFDREGVIRRANLSGARLLGVERSRLLKRRFHLFVAENDRRVFSDFLSQVFVSQVKE
jgi:PAS domain-containing protein